MPAVSERIYPVLLSKYTDKALEINFKPSAADLAFVRSKAKQRKNQCVLLIMLMVSNHLHFIPQLTDIPYALIKYISSFLGQVVFQKKALVELKDSGTLKRYINAVADGAYTFKSGFDAMADIGATPVIPLRSGTWLVEKAPSKGELLRNQLVLDIYRAGGKHQWKKATDYHRRSLAETHMMRIKTIFGNKLRARRFDNQKVEANIMAKILNHMTALGMPISIKAA